MKNTELVRIVQVFDEKLRERFLLFLESPYCTDGAYTKSIVRMIQKIYDGIDSQDDKLLKERVIYQYVYPSRHRAENLDLSNLRSQAMKLLRRFLIFEETISTDREASNSVHLAHFYAKNGLENYSERELKWLDKWSKNDTLSWDERDYMTSLQYAHALSLHQNTFNKVKGDIGLQNFLEKIDTAFLYGKFKYINMLYAFQLQNEISDTENETHIHLDISNKTKDTFEKTPIGSLLTLCNRFLAPDKEPNTLAYQAFCVRFQEVEDKLTPNDRANFAAYKRVFIAKCLDTGDDTLIRPLFEEQKAELDKQGGVGLSYSYFYSTLKLALLLDEVTWAEHFIEKYRDHIQGNATKKEETLALCSATLLFKKGFYDEAILPLVTTNFSDRQLKNISKTLEIKIMYEANDEQVHNRVQAAKMYFRRVPGLVDHHQIGFRKFVSLMQRLLHPDIGIDRLKSLRLQKAINEEKILAERLWLREVIGRKCAQWN